MHPHTVYTRPFPPPPPPPKKKNGLVTMLILYECQVSQLLPQLSYLALNLDTGLCFHIAC